MRRKVRPSARLLLPCDAAPLAVSVICSPSADPLGSDHGPGGPPSDFVVLSAALAGRRGLLPVLSAAAITGRRCGSGPALPRRPQLLLVAAELRILGAPFIQTRVIDMRCAQRSDLLLEVAQRLKPAVHGGESQVRDLVKVTERTQDCEADLV